MFKSKGFFIDPTQMPAVQGRAVGCWQLWRANKNPIARKKSCYYYYYYLSVESWKHIYLLFFYNYSIGLHVLAETNYLPKYLSSPSFSQVSAVCTHI